MLLGLKLNHVSKRGHWFQWLNSLWSNDAISLHASGTRNVLLPNGLLLNQCQAITWTDTDILPIGPTEKGFNEIWIKIKKFSFNKMNLIMLSAKWQPFCSGLNELWPSCWDPTLMNNLLDVHLFGKINNHLLPYCQLHVPSLHFNLL